MKFTKLFAAAAVAAVAMGSQSAMAASGSDTFTASATLADALIVDCGAGVLNFGTIGRGTTYTAGTDTVVVDSATAGSATTTSTALVLSGTSGRLACTVSGLALDSDTITPTFEGLTDNEVTLAGADGAEGDDLVVTLTTSVTTPASNAATLYIGGTLAMEDASAAVAGVYTSSPVTVTVVESNAP